MKLAEKNNFLITLLIIITLVKGILWAFVIPSFQAPDEHHHYATIQHYSEPKNFKPVSNDFPIYKTSFFDIRTQNLSPELRSFLEKTEFENTAFDSNGKNNFSSSSDEGVNESQIRNENLSRFIEHYPPWNINYSPFYYKVGSIIENTLSGYDVNIIERIFFLRLVSVFIYIFFIFLSYKIFQELFFSKLESILIASIISFHPMLTFIFSIINIESLLILSFALYILGSLMLIRQKANIKSVLLVVIGILLGINTKQPAYFMLLSSAPLIFLYIYSHYRDKILLFFTSKNNKIFFYLLIVLLLITISIYSIQTDYLNERTLIVTKEYIIHHAHLPISLDRSLSYWGNYGTPNVPISKYYIFTIWIILLLSTIGGFSYFYSIIKKFSKIKQNQKTLFFQLTFLTLFLCGFNIAIHLINIWIYSTHFDVFNSSLFINPDASIGNPGRYFFPTIIAKFSIIVTGLTYLFRKKLSRKLILALLLAGMILFNFYSLFNHIIPRYYL